MSGITTHILDTSRGRPAAGVRVTLEIQRAGDTWDTVGSAVTNDDGRVSDMTHGKPEAGVHRLRFDVGEYFATLGVETFSPRVEITFLIKNAGEHYHVPLLLNPFGYTTYRGS